MTFGMTPPTLLMLVCRLGEVEEKFTKFSGEPRDARENRGTQPHFEQILCKVDVKLQNRALSKFEILVDEMKFEL